MDDYRSNYPFYQYMNNRGNTNRGSYFDFKPYIPTYIGQPVKEIGDTYKQFSENLKYIHDVKDALDVALSQDELGIQPEDVGILQARKDAIRGTVDQIAGSGNFRAAGLLINKALKEYNTDTGLQAAVARSKDWKAKLEELAKDPNYTDKQKEYYLTHNPFTPTVPTNGIYSTTVDIDKPATKYDYNTFLMQFTQQYESDLYKEGFVPYTIDNKGTHAPWSGDDSQIMYWKEGPMSEVITYADVKRDLANALRGNDFADEFITDLVKVDYSDTERELMNQAVMNGQYYDYEGSMEGRKTKYIDDIVSPYAYAKSFNKTRYDYQLEPGRQNKPTEYPVGTVRTSDITTGKVDNVYEDLAGALKPSINTKAVVQQDPFGPVTGSPIITQTQRPYSLPSGTEDMVRRLSTQIPYVAPDGTKEYYTGSDITKESIEIQNKFYPGIQKFAERFLSRGSVPVATAITRSGTDVAGINEELFGKYSGKAGDAVNTLSGMSMIDYKTHKPITFDELIKGKDDNDAFPMQVTNIFSADNPFVLETGDNKYAVSYLATIGDKQVILSDAQEIYPKYNTGRIGDYSITSEWRTKNRLYNTLFTQEQITRNSPDPIVFGDENTRLYLETTPNYDYATFNFRLVDEAGNSIVSGTSDSGTKVFDLARTKAEEYINK